MSVIIIRIAAPIMQPKDTECVITAETTRMGTTAISVNGPSIEIQMCLRIIQTLVFVSTMISFDLRGFCGIGKVSVVFKFSVA